MVRTTCTIPVDQTPFLTLVTLLYYLWKPFTIIIERLYWGLLIEQAVRRSLISDTKLFSMLLPSDEWRHWAANESPLIAFNADDVLVAAFAQHAPDVAVPMSHEPLGSCKTNELTSFNLYACDGGKTFVNTVSRNVLIYTPDGYQSSALKDTKLRSCYALPPPENGELLAIEHTLLGRFPHIALMLPSRSSRLDARFTFRRVGQEDTTLTPHQASLLMVILQHRATAARNNDLDAEAAGNRRAGFFQHAPHLAA